MSQADSELGAEIGGVGKDHPLSAEKLSPVLSLYFVADFQAALDTCHALLKFGGLVTAAPLGPFRFAFVALGLAMLAVARF